MTDEKFVTPAALPNEHEREVLNIMIEECAEITKECSEITQRATKMLRFGRDETQPGQPFTNSFRLSTEIGDLNEVVRRAVKVGLVRKSAILIGEDRKREQLAKYMQTENAMADQTVHDLKCWPESFDPLLRGIKNFDLRKNDRNYKIGDILHLCEWDPSQKAYTGRELRKKIDFVMTGIGHGAVDTYHGLVIGYAILSLSNETMDAGPQNTK